MNTKKILSILVGIILGIALSYGTIVYAQSFWYPSGTNLTPVVSTWGVKIPALVSCDTIDTDASGVFSCGTDATGAGSGDVTDVGDCAGGACLDGTSDGGTYIKFYDAQGAGQLITGNLTAARVWTTPDATGTLALTSDLGSYVPYTGATADVDLGAYNLRIEGNFTFSNGTPWLNIASMEFIDSEGINPSINFGERWLVDLNGDSIVNWDNKLKIREAGSNFVAFLDASLLTSDRTFTFPDASGTMALTADFGVLETDPVVKAINGIVKSNTSTISAAVANTDYLPASGTATLSAANDVARLNLKGATYPQLWAQTTAGVDLGGISFTQQGDVGIYSSGTYQGYYVFLYGRLNWLRLGYNSSTQIDFKNGNIYGGESSGDNLKFYTTINTTKGSYIFGELTSNGFLKTSGGTGTVSVDTNTYLTSAAIDTFVKLDAIVADKALVNKADGAVWLGVHDFGEATSLEIPNGTSGTTDATGEVYLDTNGDGGTNFNGEVLQIYTGAANKYLFPMALPLAASQDNYIMKYDATAKTVQWEADSGAGGGYTNLTEFVAQTAWRVFYSNTNGDVTELALGADGTYLKSNGATSAPTFDTPAGGGGNPTWTVATKTANYTLLSSDCVILANPDSADITLTLPTASGITGKVYVIKAIAETWGEDTIVDGNASETIDGATTYTLLGGQYESITIISDGTEWRII